MTKKEELKEQILHLTREYYAEVHGIKKPFEPVFFVTPSRVYSEPNASQLSSISHK